MIKKPVVLLLAAFVVVSMAGVAAAQNKFQYGEESEKHPDCEPGQSGISSDKLPMLALLTEIYFENEDGTKDKVLLACTGEQWDGQDPNTDEDGEGVDPSNEDGAVYVNPLADKSGHDGDNDRPELTNPVDTRATAATDGSGYVSVFTNTEIYGVGQTEEAVIVDAAAQEATVAWYGEDHTDQLTNGAGPNDGNLLATVLDYIQAGVVTENDCSQSTYQDNPEQCGRDNTAITVEVGWTWLGLP